MIPKKMKALVMEQYKDFNIREWDVPEITDTQVLVKLKACAICGSDVGGSGGKNGRRIPPIIMGHEASGVIVKTGSAVRDWSVGQRVTFDSTEYCGECKFCRAGMINLCSHRKVLGVSCDEYRRHGAMAEYIAVEARTLYALPDSVSFEEAALVEPLSIGVHAAAISPIKMGDTVLINGAGTIGLMTLLAVKASGASRIVMCDRKNDKLALARAMGATDTVNTTETDAAEYCRSITNGEGADLAFDAVGMEGTINTDIAALRKGGCLVAIGNMSKEINFPLQYCITRQIRVQGSCASSGEYDICLNMIAGHSVDLTPFLQVTMPLEQGKEAFQRLFDREPGLQKIILTMD